MAPKTVRMVKLPAGFDAGYEIRNTLRDVFGVEANIAWYEAGRGFYLRLSFAVYNTTAEIERFKYCGSLAYLYRACCPKSAFAEWGDSSLENGLVKT